MPDAVLDSREWIIDFRANFLGVPMSIGIPREGSPDAVERIFLLLFFSAENPTIATPDTLPIPMTR